MRKFIQLFTVAIIAFSASILSADIKPAVIYDMVENLINRLMKAFTTELNVSQKKPASKLWSLKLRMKLSVSRVCEKWHREERTL